MNSSKDDKFFVTAANPGRGVAELLVDPVSQGWRANPSQKEFLKKTGEVDYFKKDNNCKKSEVLRMMMALIRLMVLRRPMILEGLKTLKKMTLILREMQILGIMASQR